VTLAASLSSTAVSGAGGLVPYVLACLLKPLLFFFSARLLMTAFRTQNVPPPMSSYVIDLPSTPVHIAFSPVADKLAVLLRNGSTQVWALHSVTKKLKGPRGASKAADPVLVQEDRVLSDEDVEPRQIAIGGDGVLIVLASDASDSGDVVRAKSGCQTVRKTGSRYGRLAVDGQNQVIVLSADGEVTSLGKYLCLSSSRRGIEVMPCSPR
jgi:elongator complex protein 1